MLRDFFRRSQKPERLPNIAVYINDNIGNVSFVLAWMNDRIEAVSFLSEEQARAAAGFIAFEDNQFDSVLTHFPR
jgi:hypothetical protein